MSISVGPEAAVQVEGQEEREQLDIATARARFSEGKRAERKLGLLSPSARVAPSGVAIQMPAWLAWSAG